MPNFSHIGAIHRRRLTIFAGASIIGVAVVLVATAVGFLHSTGLARAEIDRAGSASQQYDPSPLVTSLAEQAGVTGLSLLADVGSGANEVSLVAGTDATGAPCWTAVADGGNAAGPFRCGTLPTAASDALRIFPQVSGPSSSTAANAVSLVGLAGSGIDSVKIVRLDGATDELQLTGQTFGYAAETSAALPTSVEGFDASGDLVDQEKIILAGGPNCTDSSCPGPTP
jgi:hypothetical protein